MPDFMGTLCLAHLILLAEMSAESSGSGSRSHQQFPRSLSLFDIFVCSGLNEGEFLCSQAPKKVGSSVHLKTARPDILFTQITFVPSSIYVFCVVGFFCNFLYLSIVLHLKGAVCEFVDKIGIDVIFKIL